MKRTFRRSSIQIHLLGAIFNHHHYTVEDIVYNFDNQMKWQIALYTVTSQYVTRTLYITHKYICVTHRISAKSHVCLLNILTLYKQYIINNFFLWWHLLFYKSQSYVLTRNRSIVWFNITCKTRTIQVCSVYKDVAPINKHKFPTCLRGNIIRIDFS